MTETISNKELQDIVSKCIDDNYHVFLGFEVSDGNINMNQYLDKVIKHKRSKHENN